MRGYFIYIYIRGMRVRPESGSVKPQNSSDCLLPTDQIIGLDPACHNIDSLIMHQCICTAADKEPGVHLHSTI